MVGRLGRAGGAALLAALWGTGPLVGLTGRAQAAQAGQARESLSERDLLLARLALFDATAIAAGNLALEKSANPQVRQFALRLVEDHRRHLQALKAWGGSPSMDMVVADLTQPRDTAGMGGSGSKDGGLIPGPSLSMQRADARLVQAVAYAQQHLEVLREAQGRDFDEAFLKRVVDDQEGGLRLVKQAHATYKGDAAFTLMLDRTGNLADRHLQRARGLEESFE
ncbi:DUF4142 domain-containing protein [Myxococcus sp. AM009]|uniref:DUF4142 domain-containing protein n=1 Tax=unclassified Myxococcus TaxID=2648731 RepID=UPI001594F3A6|nr:MULTISPECIES: DUF4142 domain-containing protein [unclassified Myxococcus]NVI99687.1 DUF4142 domain-containing protein [Myxococcus sp. AM009]NVJ15782.1 DUF4142 domain-containing protein [Myxococcus sp. AM010]